MSKLLRSIFLLTAMTMAQFAQAGDTARFELLGISDDGKALAYEEYGTQDGSGSNYVSIYFVNTEKNAFAAPAIKIVDEAETETGITKTLAEVKRTAEKQAAPILRKLKINLTNRGVATELPILNAKTDGADRTIYAYNLAKGVRDARYDLRLKTLPMTSTKCADIGFDTNGFELTVDIEDIDNSNKTITLQKDTELPDSRSCPMSYSIRDVLFTEQGQIIAVLNMHIVGFEGPDVRYLVVTGKLPGESQVTPAKRSFWQKFKRVFKL